jgi:hypothetical protein
MASFVNACVFTASSGGTGTFTVSAAVTGWQTPAQAGAVDGASYRYRAYSSDLTEWEIGTGTYTASGTTLTRTVTASSNAGSAVNFTAAPSVALTMFGADIPQVGTITFIIDGGGSAITTGEKGDLTIPFDCVINEWTLLADQSGSIVVDIWKDTYANYPPTVADTITGSAKPTISSSTKGQSSTLTGWTTTITAGDCLAFNVDSASTVQRVTLSLKFTRT